MPNDLASTLRTQVKSSRLSENQIAKESGVNQSSLNLFMNGHRDLRLQTATRLSDYFGLCFCPVDSPSSSPK